MEEHPTNEDFSRFLQQSTRPSFAKRNALVVRHLLAGCESCRQTLLDLPGGSQVIANVLGVPSAPLRGRSSEAPSYDWAFARANRALANLLSGGVHSERLPEQLVTLSSLPEGEQFRLVAEDPSFADPDLIDCLLERSHAARYQSPRKTLHNARLAHRAAEACRPENAGGQIALVELRVRAQGAYGNALRICGNLREADDALSGALALCSSENVSPRARADLLSQIATLRMFQRRLEEALSITEKALAICQDLGGTKKASLMVQRGIALLYSGAAVAAALLVQEAIPLIDRDEDPHLFLAALHNLALCQIDLGRPEEAMVIFYDARELYQECKDPLILLRASWHEGRLLREIGHLRNAEVALLRAREGFSEQGLAYEAAMVCLDLAEVYAKLGQTDKLRQTTTEALPIFKALQIDREALALLIRLHQSADAS